jgi:hypothetical protein
MDYSKQRFLINSILRDTGLQFSAGSFLAGGFLTSIFTGAEIKDIDIFFESEDAMTKFMLLNLNKDQLANLISTDNAVTYRITLSPEKSYTIQLITRIYGTPQQIIDQFDFTVCMCAYTPQDDGKFIMNPNFILHLAERTLCFNGKAKYPIATLVRTKKYIEKGYSLAPIEYVKLALAINNLDLKDWTTVREQLEGIDLALFQSLISKLPEGETTEFEYETFMALLEDTLDNWNGD